MYNEWSDLIEGIDYFELKIKNGTSLQGDEHNIQRWIVQALKKELQLYELSNNNMYKIFVDRIFDEKTVELVSKLVKQLEKINPDLYYTNYFDSIALSLLVFVQRKMIGCSMTSKIQDILTLPMLASYQIAITISEEIYKESEIILNQYDIEYISFLLFTHKILPSKDSNIGNENIHVLTKKLISNLEDLSSIEFEDEELFHSLRSHIGPMIYPA